VGGDNAIWSDTLYGRISPYPKCGAASIGCYPVISDTGFPSMVF
jgi:hypothetical protein